MALRKSYLVVYQKAKRRFWGFAPDVPGCFSTGRNLKHMREMLTEALEFHLSSILCDGDPIPEPFTTTFDFGEFRGEPDETEYLVVEWLDVKISRKAYRSAKKIEPGYSIIQAARANQEKVVAA
jgi:predicted RNase H-like HicB family nuclease